MAPYFKLLQTRGGQHGAPVVSALSCRNMFLDCAVCGDGLDPVVPRPGDLGVIATGGADARTSADVMGTSGREEIAHMEIRITFTNGNPNTIWNKLAAKLGRQPTNAEATAEVRRILTESLVDRAMQGKLAHQRGRVAA